MRIARVSGCILGVLSHINTGGHPQRHREKAAQCQREGTDDGRVDSALAHAIGWIPVRNSQLIAGAPFVNDDK